MNILICPAHNYVMPYGIMLESLFTNNESNGIQIYAIVNDDVTESDKRTLDDIALKHHSGPIRYHVISESLCDTFPSLSGSLSHISISTYYRLFAATILPRDVEKILYLDGDIIVMESLKDLWETNMDSIAIAGVMDVFDIANYNRLHYPSHKGYLNAGVLLMNLDYWRKNHVEERFKDFIQNYPERIKMHDQDILNYTFRDEKCILPLINNVLCNVFFKPEYSKYDYWNMENEILEARKHPVILHFAGRMKPWHKGNRHPRVKDFYYYKSRTIWANTPLTKPKLSILQQCYYFLRMILIKLHILSSKVVNNRYIDSYNDKKDVNCI